MSDSLQALLKEFEEVAQEGQTLAFLPRDTALQRAAVDKIDTFLRALGQSKELAVRKGDEGSANAILAMELTLNTVRNQLLMWVALKQDAPESAWDHLVDAQQACDTAITVRRQLASNPE